jgi:hypothetical protein
VPNKDTGVASSLLNTGQQVGGSIGLAILGTVAWSAVASNTKSAIAATNGAHLSTAAQTAISNHALAFGFGKGYLVSAGISLLAVVIALVMIRIKRSDMEGIDPMAAPVLSVRQPASPAACDVMASRLPGFRLSRGLSGLSRLSGLSVVVRTRDTLRHG